MVGSQAEETGVRVGGVDVGFDDFGDGVGAEDDGFWGVAC